MPRSAKILLVEDDRRLGAQVLAQLEQEGCVVRWVRTGEEAIRAPLDAYSLVVLDVGLPGIDGLAVLEHVRRSSDVPVLLLTARADPASRVRGLELGADDYLAKPFWPDELSARVRARLRRPVLQRDAQLRIGALAIDFVAQEATLEGEALELTPGERALLLALARRPGAAISRRALAELALDPERDASDRALDIHVSRLRKKLGALGDLVETVRGIGYRLRAPEDAR